MVEPSRARTGGGRAETPLEEGGVPEARFKSGGTGRTGRGPQGEEEEPDIKDAGLWGGGFWGTSARQCTGSRGGFEKARRKDR